MAKSLNQVILLGNLTADPEIKEAGESKLATFSMALSRRAKQGDEWVDEVDFVDLKTWAANADYVAKLKKGEKLLVVGSLRTEKWEKDGQKRQKNIVFVQQIVPLSYKTEAEKPASGYDTFRAAGQKLKEEADPQWAGLEVPPEWQ